MRAVTFHIIELFVVFDFSYMENIFSFFFFDNLLGDVFDCMSMTYEQRPERPAN